MFPSAVVYRLLAIFTSFGGNNYFGCGDESCEKWLFIVVIHADKSRRWQDQPRPQGLFIFGKRDPGEEVIRYHHKQDHNLTVLSMRNCGLTLRAFFRDPPVHGVQNVGIFSCGMWNFLTDFPRRTLLSPILFPPKSMPRKSHWNYSHRSKPATKPVKRGPVTCIYGVEHDEHFCTCGTKRSL